MNKILLLVLIVPLSVAFAYSAQERNRAGTWPAFLKRFDTDGDGKISASEYTRNKFVFKRLDRDSDGFVTEAEFTSATKAGADKGKAKDAPAPASAPATIDASPEALAFFEAKIRPVLVGNCYECHSASAVKLKGGLRLDSREAELTGGSSGPAVVPGDPEASLLVQAVRYSDENLQMPPKKRLSAESVHDFEHWVSLGAPWPMPGPDAAPAAAAEKPAEKHVIDFEKARSFWAFQPPLRRDAPATKDEKWGWSEIDRFLLAEMEAAGITPVADADKRTWLRRVSFDLTGLPPTPEELAAFEKDKTSGAFESVVDRLLDSRAFGERWGRHWLDVARYAESSGKDSNVLYPHAWRYRDYVIASFNDDKPYDRFLREQLAGDLLPATDDDQRAAQEIATGYLALGSKSHNTRDRRQFALDVADEQIDAISQGMLGLTVSCARCHDHKFDPIPTEDYYGMAGILLSTETCYGTKRENGNLHPAELIDLPAAAHVPNGPAMSAAQRAFLERARDVATRLAGDDAGMPRKGAKKAATGDDDKRPDQVDQVRARAAREQVEIFDDLLARFDDQGRAKDSNRLAMGAKEGQPRDVPVLERGEIEKAGAVAKRGFLQVINTPQTPRITKGSGRKELADWIASSSNPLTARVWANRVWLHLFGTGIVSTPNNFGASGQRPDHPELLDWLATELVKDGWSTKKLVRELVLSHVYRLAAVDEPKALAADPEVHTLWRMPERRLEAEAIRDAMLAAAGTLDPTPPVGSPVGALEGVTRREELLATIKQERPVRSVYLPILREHLPDALEVFDAADPSFVTGDREETNVATQALYLMNDADVLATADAFAARVLAHEGSDDARIEYAFELALGRKPDGTEKDAVRRFLEKFPKTLAKDKEKDKERDADGGERRGRRRDVRAAPREKQATDARLEAWSAFVQTLFQSAEFRYLG